MKIATRLKFSALVPLLMAVVIGLALFVSNGIMKKAEEEADSARRIVTSMNNINTFARHYMAYHEDRARLQFLAEHDAMTSRISAMRFSDAKKQQILNTIRNHTESMREAFLKLVSNYENRGSVSNPALLREAEERLAGRILVKTSDALSEAVHLNGLITNEFTSTQGRISAFVFFLIICTTVPFTIVLIRMMSGITRALALLRKGTEVVSSGNLTHRIGVTARDEIGDLSRAFNLMTGTLRDITVSRDELGKEVEERKRAQEELHEQREWLHITLSSIGDAVIATDKEGRISFLNPVAVALTGWQTEDALEQPIQSVFRIINEKTHAPAEDLVRRVLSEKRVVGLANDTALVRKDGREIPIEDSAAPILDADRNITGVVLVFHDVTQKRRAQEALRQSERRYRSFVDVTSQFAWVTDANGLVVEDIPALRKFTGQTYEQTNGAGWSAALHPEDLQRTLKVWNQALSTKTQYEIEYRMRRHDGVYRLLLARGVPILDEQGNVLEWVGTCIDITHQKEAEEALKKAHDELEIRVRERTSELSEAVERLRVENIQRKQLEDTLRESENQVRFFASQCLTAQETERKRVAGELHDSIAASLGAVRLRIDRVAEAMQKGPCGPESLQDIASAVTVINQEVRRIMADLRPSILDDLGIIPALTWLCREYQKTYSHISVDSQIGVSEEEVPDSLKTPIFRICQEAMNNIAKYSKASLVNLSLKKRDAQIGLTIQDNGQGFDLETVKKGMGLSTMKERAQLSGGSFSLETAKGKGTIVLVSWAV